MGVMDNQLLYNWKMISVMGSTKGKRITEFFCCSASLRVGMDPTDWDNEEMVITTTCTQHCMELLLLCVTSQWFRQRGQV